MNIVRNGTTLPSSITVCTECGAEAAIVPTDTGRLATACGHPLNFTVKPNPAAANRTSD